MGFNQYCCESGRLAGIANKYSIFLIVNKRANEIHDTDPRLINAGPMAAEVITSENYIQAFHEVNIWFNVPV